jgi:hypothetical protein
VHSHDDHETAFEPTEAQLRWSRASLPIRQAVNGYMCTFHDLDLEITDDVLGHMMDSAEAKYELHHGTPAPEPRVPDISAVGRHDPVVYYMRFSDLVKIGTTTDVATRRIAVPCQGVMAIEWGGRELEMQRHAEFVDSHKYREWFCLDARLGAHIAGVRESFEAAVGCTTEVWLEHHR